jgi:molybdate transport system substrate-binding protein
MSTLLFRILLAITVMPIPGQVLATDIRIAVASNFSRAMKAAADAFETNSGHQVTLAFGSTGKQYAQIKNGAPFDAFFAADTQRPERLEEEGLTIPGSRFTYALGKLVLWSPTPSYVDSQGNILQRGGFRYLAMANPALAPYGVAAREVLQARNLWDELEGHLVRGENISQAFQFVASGNAQLGFVAWSQIKQPGDDVEGSFWDVPAGLYTPIEQQAVLLHDSEAGRAFMAFMRSEEAVGIIRDHGYQTVDTIGPDAH